MRRARLTMVGRNRLTGLAFFLPWIIGFLSLTAFPMIYSLVISVSDVRIRVTGTEMTFLGLNHFRYALLQDANFPTDLLESLFLIVAGLPIVMVFSLVIALLLNRKFRGRAFFRALFFLPVIIMSGPVLTQLVQETDAMQLQMNYGILREYFYYLNGRFFVLFMDNLVRTLWFAGVQIMVFLAVLQKVDQSMYEAASIDGATGWEMFWRITLPHLRPAILLNAIYTIVEMGSVSSDPTNVRIMTHLLEVNRPYSYSAAMAWIYAIAQLILIGITALILVEKRGRRRT